MAEKRIYHESTAHSRRSVHTRAKRAAAPMIAQPWDGRMRLRSGLKIEMKKSGKRIAGA